MITTKNTYMYRVIGVVGAALILLGVFLPWVTINAGKLESYDTDTAPSGWIRITSNFKLRTSN